MQKNQNRILSEVATYYEKKIAEYGDAPLGVDWNSRASQQARFGHLCKIIEPKNANFSLNDLGRGYGALLDYLRENFGSFNYLGVDVSQEMIKGCKIFRSR